MPIFMNVKKAISGVVYFNRSCCGIDRLISNICSKIVFIRKKTNKVPYSLRSSLTIVLNIYFKKRRGIPPNCYLRIFSIAHLPVKKTQAAVPPSITPTV